ncbi:MAG: PKD domain-containing protein [Pirellulales bacterium]|nr:PKD domain-containing protein [Pirellulales bacterium]
MASFEVFTIADMDPITPLMRIVDISLDETQTITLHDNSQATVKLLAVHETRDSARQAIRQASVDIELNGESATLQVAGYHLPVQMGKVQIDCPAISGFAIRATRDWWQIKKDARFRLWPANGPLTAEGSLAYPVKRRWFSDKFQACSDPCYVNGEPTDPEAGIYYHAGFDIGGSEGQVEVFAATDGVVVSSGDTALNEGEVPVRYDVVYVMDARGWYYRYSHLSSIDEAITVGTHIEQGQRIGVLGKEGGSGGWSHLHFGITGKQPSGERGEIDAYALLWEAYQKEYGIALQAVGGPHLYAPVGQTVTLDASRSWSIKGPSHITTYRWLLTNGSNVESATVEHSYYRPGMYSELFSITDADGQTSWGRTTVLIVKNDDSAYKAPGIHATYHPTLDLKAGQEITFKVRTFQVAGQRSGETWDFGDGSDPVTVHSDGNANQHAPDGYAVTAHRFEKAGTYFVTVTRETEGGELLQERMALEIS